LWTHLDPIARKAGEEGAGEVGEGRGGEGGGGMGRGGAGEEKSERRGMEQGW